MNDFMNEQKLKVLLAGNNPDDSLYWGRMLSVRGNIDLEFIPREELSDMDHHRGKNAPDLLFLDLSTTDKDILQVFLGVHNVVPTVPVIVTTETENLELAAQLLKEGAQDCLVKDSLNAGALNRILCFALARQRSIQQLRSFSLFDELTGLYNRRGFLTMADYQLKLANRTGQSLLLAFIDVDGLKTINDLLGHQRGDLALIETAHIMREAFRETDILARLGGDEFVALLVCDGEIHAEALTRQFRKTIEEHNSLGKRGFQLSASIGMALSDPASPSSIGDLLEKADKLMYEQKNSGRRLSVSYQLRFLKSVPIGAWLKTTAALLVPMIPEEAWPKPFSTHGEKVRELKQALSVGLLSFVVRRSLCGSETVCDLGCSPALENKSPDRFEACTILGPTRQYLVEGVQNLEEMSKRLTNSVLKELPGAIPVAGKIQYLLRDSLSAHLYENIQCHKAPLCQQSKKMNLKWELQHSRQDHPHTAER